MAKGPVYILEPGTSLFKSGSSILVKKDGRTIRRVFLHEIADLVIFGDIPLSAQIRNMLLDKGIDLILLNENGGFITKLVREPGKNIPLRVDLFRILRDGRSLLDLRIALFKGACDNKRALLRRYNRERKSNELAAISARLRSLARKSARFETTDKLEAACRIAREIYTGCLGSIVIPDRLHGSAGDADTPGTPLFMIKDFTEMLLRNSLNGILSDAGFDLPAADDLENKLFSPFHEFEPVLVDSLVLTMLNKKIINSRDFRRKRFAGGDRRAFTASGEFRFENEVEFVLEASGMKKIIYHFQKRLSTKVHSPDKKKQLSYERVVERQILRLASSVSAGTIYEPFKYR